MHSVQAIVEEKPLLDGYLVLETDAFEKVADLLNRTPTPHSFDLVGSDVFRTRIRHAPLSAISLTATATTGRVRVTVGPSTSTYILWIVLRGATERRVAGHDSIHGSEEIVLHSPDGVTDIRNQGDFEDLGVTIDEKAVRSEVENQLGQAVNKSVKFASCLKMPAIAARMLRDHVIRICHALDGRLGLHARDSLRSRQMERSLIALLVSAHRHNYTRLLNRVSSPAPWQVRAAEDFIEAHADRPLTLGDLAALTGVSARTLEYGFRKHRGCGPMQFLRNVRYENSYAELQSPQPGETVSSIAAKWGFLHFGRFAAGYQQRFSESPSATLRRARGN